MVDGYSNADWLFGQLQAGAAAQVQHGFVKHARHHVDGLPHISQNFPGVLRCVLIGHQLELHVGAGLPDLGPQVHQKLRGGHDGRADADDMVRLFHSVFGPGDGVFAVLDDIYFAS